MRLGENDVVLVTGGASGLGAATVRRGGCTGASALIVDLPSSREPELASQLGSGCGSPRPTYAMKIKLQAAVGAATDLGTLRVVVNCAGVGTPGRVIGKRGVLPLEDFRTVIDINLVGTFNVLRLVGSGDDGKRASWTVIADCVIMTASVAAFDGQIGQAAYAASKGGVVCADTHRCQRPCRQGNPGDDASRRGHGNSDDGWPAR